MTAFAKTHQIGRAVIVAVEVDVVNIKHTARRFASHTAMIVALSDRLFEIFGEAGSSGLADSGTSDFPAPDQPSNVGGGNTQSLGNLPRRLALDQDHSAELTTADDGFSTHELDSTLILIGFPL